MIPPGRFAEDVTKPVVAHPFLLGKTEVTQGQWKALRRTEPWKGRPYTIEGSDVAATFVSWDDAVAFCRQLTARERRDGRIGSEQKYRLPTQAEWEFACRAGADTSFCFGNARRLMGSYACVVRDRQGRRLCTDPGGQHGQRALRACRRRQAAQCLGPPRRPRKRHGVVRGPLLP